MKKDFEFHFYNGDWTFDKYFLKTILMSTISVILIVISTFFSLSISNMIPLIVTLVIFTIFIIWYILYNNQFTVASYSTLVKHDSKVWYITINPRRYSVYASGHLLNFPNTDEAAKKAKSKEYLKVIIEKIENGELVFNFFKGGDYYTIFNENKIVKETDKFLYIEGDVFKGKKVKHKIVKITKEYDDIKSLFN